MTIYINGIKASKTDKRQLESDIKAGKVKVSAKTTKKGNIAYKTEG
jgi:hypothetical protein